MFCQSAGSEKEDRVTVQNGQNVDLLGKSLLKTFDLASLGDSRHDVGGKKMAVNTQLD